MYWWQRWRIFALSTQSKRHNATLHILPLLHWRSKLLVGFTDCEGSLWIFSCKTLTYLRLWMRPRVRDLSLNGALYNQLDSVLQVLYNSKCYFIGSVNYIVSSSGTLTTEMPVFLWRKTILSLVSGKSYSSEKLTVPCSWALTENKQLIVKKHFSCLLETEF